MFGYAAWKASIVSVRAAASASEDCQPESLAVPLTDCGSKAAEADGDASPGAAGEPAGLSAGALASGDSEPPDEQAAAIRTIANVPATSCRRIDLLHTMRSEAGSLGTR